MRSGKNIGFLFVAFALSLLLSACVPSVSMKQEALMKGDITRGSVVVGTVSNKRSDDNGGKSFESLGKLRGGYGNPFDLETESGREIDVLLKEVAAASLEHSGYFTDPAAGKYSRLDIDVLKFWCDGYTGYKIEAEIAVKLIDPVNGKILARKTINVQKGFAIVAGYGPMHEAYNEVINDIQKELVTFMQSKEFRSAVK